MPWRWTLDRLGKLAAMVTCRTREEFDKLMTGRAR